MFKLKLLTAAFVVAGFTAGSAGTASAADNVDNYLSCVHDDGGARSWCCAKYGGTWVESTRWDGRQWIYLKYCQIDPKTRVYFEPDDPGTEPPSSPTGGTHGGSDGTVSRG